MKSLDKFLKNHIPGDGQSCTHTRIGNASLNLYGGKYYISPEDLPEFYNLYHKKVFLEKKDEYYPKGFREMHRELKFRHYKPPQKDIKEAEKIKKV